MCSVESSVGTGLAIIIGETSHFKPCSCHMKPSQCIHARTVSTKNNNPDLCTRQVLVFKTKGKDRQDIGRSYLSFFYCNREELSEDH